MADEIQPRAPLVAAYPMSPPVVACREIGMVLDVTLLLMLINANRPDVDALAAASQGGFS